MDNKIWITKMDNKMCNTRYDLTTDILCNVSLYYMISY